MRKLEASVSTPWVERYQVRGLTRCLMCKVSGRIVDVERRYWEKDSEAVYIVEEHGGSGDSGESNELLRSYGITEDFGSRMQLAVM